MLSMKPASNLTSVIKLAKSKLLPTKQPRLTRSIPNHLPRLALLTYPSPPKHLPTQSPHLSPLPCLLRSPNTNTRLGTSQTSRVADTNRRRNFASITLSPQPTLPKSALMDPRLLRNHLTLSNLMVLARTPNPTLTTRLQSPATRSCAKPKCNSPMCFVLVPSVPLMIVTTL